MTVIKTKHCGNLEITTIDYITGEGTDEIRLDIDSKDCSAWINLTNEEAKHLRDELNEWLEETN